MKDLYVIRHGIADDAADHGGHDEERMLTKKGKDRVSGLAKYLDNIGVRLDVVISSPLVRAVETAEIVRKKCSDSKEITITDMLKPGGSCDNLIGYLNKVQGMESIAIVGHEPFLSGFISYSLSRSRHPYVLMKKAGVALLTYEDQLKPGNCELEMLMGPAQMEICK